VISKEKNMTSIEMSGIINSLEGEQKLWKTEAIEAVFIRQPRI
jgi:hypothetical protein